MLRGLRTNRALTWLRLRRKRDRSSWARLPSDTSARSLDRSQRRPAAFQHIGQRLTALGKTQCDGIQAVPLSGRTRTIGEHVAQMGSALRALDLGAAHPVAGVIEHA